MKAVVIINAMQLMITKASAAEGEILPEGISRMAVLGLMASMRASSQRLKAMAALRAKTMAAKTKTNINHKGFDVKESLV